jgi:hypothetical protein
VFDGDLVGFQRSVEAEGDLVGWLLSVLPEGDFIGRSLLPEFDYTLSSSFWPGFRYLDLAGSSSR